MLNISPNSVSPTILKKRFSAVEKVESKNTSKVLRRLIIGASIVGFVILLLPWTQNIRSEGLVTTFSPNQKPQTIHSIIGGKIEEWYVREGDFVNKGDTILRLSEIKDDYFDSSLLTNVDERLGFKQKSIEAYKDKIKALGNRFNAIENQKEISLKQAKIKLKQLQLNAKNDSINYTTALNNYQTSVLQFNRMDSLYQKGLKSLTDLENRNIAMQKAMAYEVESQIKWLNSKNAVNQGEMEIPNIAVKYDSELYKIQSELYSVQSAKLEAETELNKLQNSFNNYSFRSSLYFVTAPIDGYLSKTIQEGIGKTIKEGDAIVRLMPTDANLAVELYVEPIDLPLLEIGQHVRIQFDGWPAIVFSGWPNASYGTYGGNIIAIDKHIGENGKYRVLVEKDESEHKWPTALRYGSGTSNMILLKDVPVWYELWRKVNGFPPDFYKTNGQKDEKKSK